MTTEKKPKRTQAIPKAAYGKLYQDEVKEVIAYLDSPAEIKLYCALVSMRKADTHKTPPTGDGALIGITGFSRSGVKRARKMLKAKGFITATGGRGRGVRTVYTLTWRPKDVSSDDETTQCAEDENENYYEEPF
jgi:hypothetical protein